MPSLGIAFYITIVLLTAVMNHLIARSWSPERLFFVRLGRPLNDVDRARIRRAMVINAACMATTLLMLWQLPESILRHVLMITIPVIPTLWIHGESSYLSHDIESDPIPERYQVLLDAPTGVTRYLSAPLQLINLILLAVFVVLYWHLQSIILLSPTGLQSADAAPTIIASVVGIPVPLWRSFGVAATLIVLIGVPLWSIGQLRWSLPETQIARYIALQYRFRILLVRLIEWCTFAFVLAVVMLIIATIHIVTNAALMPGLYIMVASGLIFLIVSGSALILIAVRLSYIRDQCRTIAGTDVLGTRNNGWRRGGVVYWAPHDPAWIVPDRRHLGVTLNWARPAAWLLMASVVSALGLALWLVRGG